MEEVIPMIVTMTMIMMAVEEGAETGTKVMAQEGGEIEVNLEKESQTETGVRTVRQEGVNPVAESPGE